MSTLLVDNYDSYTYNVFHLLAAVSGEEPIVVHNDMVSWRALSRWDFDAIVLSPGPGRPERWHDFGVCSDILRCSEIPVLGICLGHQGLGRVLDGMVAARRGDARAPEPGASSGQRPVRGNPAGLLGRALPLARGDRAARPRRAGDGVDRGGRRDGNRTSPPSPVGGAVPSRVDRHRARPEAGRELLPTRARPPARARRSGAMPVPSRAPAGGSAASGDWRRAARRWQLNVRTLAGEASTQPLFERLFGQPSTPSGWTAPTRLRGLAQCSFLGTSAGAERCVLEYDVHAGR